ncbi:hypothetical protein G6F63_014664 [Rhizopus arrhizus]|nr:hypothetical protein G6F63_014664 [Rhizopus arrhizus]
MKPASCITVQQLRAVPGRARERQADPGREHRRRGRPGHCLRRLPAVTAGQARPDPGGLHSGPALLPRLRPGMAQQEPRAGTAQFAADRRACTGPVPRTDRAQHRRLVPGVRSEGRPEAVPGPGQAGQGVVM